MILLLLSSLLFLATKGQKNDTVAIIGRPRMINLINAERLSHNLPFLCQDSHLSSAAQQHANDMATIDFLGTDLPCDGTVIPAQYCTTSGRLSRLNSSFENVIKVFGNGTAEMAMIQLGQSAAQSSSLINPDIKYVGVGVAYNNQSNNFYWSQVFSTGNFSQVNCTDRPFIETINAQNITHSYTQPSRGLNYTLYPAVGLKDLKCSLQPANMTEMMEAAQAALGDPSAHFNATQREQGKVASFLLSTLNNSTTDANATYTTPTTHINPLLLDQIRLNMTLKAIQVALRNDSSLQAGLNGTNPAAFNQLFSRLQSNSNITSIPGIEGNL